MVKKTHMMHVGLTVAGVFASGLWMDMLRNNEIVGQAISGYDK